MTRHEKKNRGRRVPRAHRHTLAELNRSAFTARRDTAHECICDILNGRIMRSPRHKRLELYQLCLRLIGEARFAHSRSEVTQEGPIPQYLNLLHRTMAASLALVEHEAALAEETDDLPTLSAAGTALVNKVSDTLSANEESLLKCILELIRFGTPILKENTRMRLAVLRPDEKKRYNTARREYEAYFRRQL